MKEKALVPLESKKSTVPSSKILALVPLLLLLRDKNSQNSSIKSIVEPLDNIISSLNPENLSKALDPQNIEAKVATLKKVGPYMPESTIPTINSLVLTFEKITKIVSLADFIYTTNSYGPIEPREVRNNMDRVNKMAKALKDDMPEDTAKKVLPVLDIATNADKIQSIVSTISGLLNKNAETKVNLEDLVDIAAPFLGNNKNFDKDKIKEMVGMIEMMRLLNEEDNDKGSNSGEASNKDDENEDK